MKTLQALKPTETAKITTRVAYCYPSSPMSNTLRCPKTGCYYVAVVSGDDDTKTSQPFPTLEAAKGHAATLPFPAHRWTM
jgi:hypothetical protein